VNFATDRPGAERVVAEVEQIKSNLVPWTPLGRVGTPADIASVAVFLASDEAGWLTGECLAVSGALR
jgi:3-oxoacyl-[acyl-carrier protein] reductase